MSVAPSRVSRRAHAIGTLALAWLGALAPGLAAAAAAAAPADCPPVAAPIGAEGFRAGLSDAVADHGFLWRIERDGRSSYLYGTIHVARPEWMYPGALTKQAMAKGDTVALELDVLDPGITARLLAGVKARPGDALPAELAERLDRHLVAECMDPATWHAFMPEFQVGVLDMMAGRRQGVDAAYGIDGVLAIAGRVLAKSVVSLETPESQAATMRAPTSARMIELVRGGLDDLDAGRAGLMMSRLVDAWRTSDLATLDDYERWCDCMGNDADRQTMKVLLDDRNDFLAAKIDALHTAGQGVFAAVGSLHMIGPRGLPALMRERGFRVDLLVPSR